MSPRAAWRLEELGFTDVYDFVPGKAAWLAMGWPTQGRESERPTVGRLARTEVPRAVLGETAGAARRRAVDAGVDYCLVLNRAGIFMGRLHGEALQVDPATPVEQAMQGGSSTVRPSEDLDQLAQRMSKRRTESVVVTDLRGRLIGTLMLEDALRALGSGSPSSA